jgi:hypothetical protein
MDADVLVQDWLNMRVLAMETELAYGGKMAFG